MSDSGSVSLLPRGRSKAEEDNAISLGSLERYVWSEQQVSSIMGAFYYGYMIMQIPGGYLATVYGGKWVFSFGVAMASILTLLTPSAAAMGPHALWLVRFLMGLFEAVTFPSFTAMLGQWVPIFEKSMFSALSLSGGTFGNVVFQILMGYICSYDSIGGWPMGFYLIGSLGLLFVFYWNKHISSFPQDHPSIDPLELEFIQRNTQPVVPGGVAGGSSSSSGSSSSLPWRKVFSSTPMWAIICAHFGNTFLQYGLMTCLPQYLSHVLNFDISQNGLLCALPWAFCFMVTQLVSYITDKLREARVVTTTRIRRINGLIGALTPALFLVLTGYSGCNYVMAVFCLTLGLSFAGFTASAYNCNHLDLSPQHAGTLFGITNTFATMSGFLAPALASWLTSANPRDRVLWQQYFYITAAVDALGGTFYFLFASGELQNWSSQKGSSSYAKLKKRVETV
ncbi:sialin-like isoform X1 [Symsagittifera roscoffensis]